MRGYSLLPRLLSRPLGHSLNYSDIPSKLPSDWHPHTSEGWHGDLLLGRGRRRRELRLELAVSRFQLPAMSVRYMAEGHQADPRDFKRMNLSPGNVRFILVAYATILLLGAAGGVYGIVTFHTSPHKETLGFLSGLAMSLSGSAIFYIRKLYRACINDTYTFADPGSVPDRIKRIGTMAFFLCRPLFGAGFAVIIYSLWRLSILATESATAEPGPGFIYFAVALGFLSGFLAGRVMAKLEGHGLVQINSLLGSDGR